MSQHENDPPHDDPVLLERFRQKDREAFDTLFARYAGPVLAFATRLTGSRTDAEDLVQETFVAAYRGASGYRGGARLLTYLLAITLRRHRDRRRRTIPPQVSFAEETDTASESSLEGSVVATVAFRGALQGLPETLRTAFLLVAAQGLTHKEAAGVLGIPVGTVKWRVAEATRRLRAALEETETDKTHEVKRDVPEILAG